MTPHERSTVVKMLDKNLFHEGCDAFRIYSNVSFLHNISNHPKCNGCYEQVIHGPMLAPKGGPYNTALNSVPFNKAFKHVFDTGVYEDYNWTVKFDADAVWIPERLRGLLSMYQHDVPVLGGNTIEGCKLVYGPIEIMSKAAMSAYARARWKCTDSLESIEYDANFGEDVSLQRCMHISGARLAPMPLMLSWTTPGNCLGCEVAFHPFKAPEDWESCYDQLRKQGLGPITECEPRSFDSEYTDFLKNIAPKFGPGYVKNPDILVNEAKCNAMTREDAQSRFAEEAPYVMECEGNTTMGWTCNFLGAEGHGWRVDPHE
jgi:hypothetical protein